MTAIINSIWHNNVRYCSRCQGNSRQSIRQNLGLWGSESPLQRDRQLKINKRVYNLRQVTGATHREQSLDVGIILVHRPY